ncbi:MAG: hypothetical protein JWN72_415 [Thermoleophilia bacterium]|nr:hypothetical protein [Thermoleophilia bacterium]
MSSSDTDRTVTIDVQTATESPITAADVQRLRSEAGVDDEPAEPRTPPVDASSDAGYDDDASADHSADHDIDRALEHHDRPFQDQPDGVPEGAGRTDEMPGASA